MALIGVSTAATEGLVRWALDEAHFANIFPSENIGKFFGVNEMRSCRPAMRVFKTLVKRGVDPTLASLAEEVKIQANSSSDGGSSIPLFTALDKALSWIEDHHPLLKDARRYCADGTLPNKQAAMTKKVGHSVYELRDKNTGWRAAMVLTQDIQSQLLEDRSDSKLVLPDAWCVFVEEHDTFHSPATVRDTFPAQSCPTSDDLEVYDFHVKYASDKQLKTAALVLTVDLLQSVVERREPATGSLEVGPDVECVDLTVDIDFSAPEADAAAKATDILGNLSLTVTMKHPDDRVLSFLTHTIVPFLQPDQSLIETSYKDAEEFTLIVLVNAAELFSRITDDIASESLTPPTYKPPAPTHLHYVDKTQLVGAHVEKTAIKPLCGQWFVPIGDERTHDLPICPECDDRRPIQEFLKLITLR
ncbi:DUF3039 domain-containing protein [Corynebacterium aquilae]|uniref:DUF3039 domain-containing protein n=1 Tax=Corynebacterium aquilae DSM 44791 TaxID=1431546 RepID=A0A1L7CD73_9CORY|nr:DUF3039 domain-containing protein [Corynebacterium aquilae]APT83788.1 hypothetical protein CAQU_00320 [Corynebacterium aquilae DSM 44791]